MNFRVEARLIPGFDDKWKYVTIEKGQGVITLTHEEVISMFSTLNGEQFKLPSEEMDGYYPKEVFLHTN